MFFSICVLVIYIVLTAYILRIGEGSIWIKSVFALVTIIFPILSILADLSIVGLSNSDYSEFVAIVAAIMNPGLMLLIFKRVKLIKSPSKENWGNREK